MFDVVGERDSRSRGFESRLPVTYTGGFVVSAVYLVRTEVARRCVHCNLHPLTLIGKRSVVVLTLFDFRASSIGPYREVSLGVLVSSVPSRIQTVLEILSGSSVAGAWVLALPVTSELACEGGVELFGYPKTVNEIDVHVTPNYCSYVVREGTQHLLSVDVPLGFGLRVPVRNLVTYSELGGELRQTTIPVRWAPRISRARGTRLSFTPGDAPLASALTRLELPTEPTFVLHGGEFAGTLVAPERV